MKNLILVLLFLFCSGCAVGNKYNYQTSPIKLPIKTESNKLLVLLVTDQRPYIINGDKKPNFVGLHRGGFGEPYDVTTQSGNPLATEMTSAIADSLRNAGYSVADAYGNQNMESLVVKAAREGASRIIVLRVDDWKSDVMMSIGIHCNMTLNVYDADGRPLATNSVQFTGAVDGAQLTSSRNSKVVAKEFAKQVGYLFGNANVRDALD